MYDDHEYYIHVFDGERRKESFCEPQQPFATEGEALSDLVWYFEEKGNLHYVDARIDANGNRDDIVMHYAYTIVKKPGCDIEKVDYAWRAQLIHEDEMGDCDE